MGGWTQRILCNYLFCSIYTRLSTVNRIYFPINYILRCWGALSLAHYIIAKGNFCGAKRYGSKRQPIWFMTNKSSLYFVVSMCERKANKSAINLLNIHMMKCTNPNKLSHNLFTVNNELQNQNGFVCRSSNQKMQSNEIESNETITYSLNHLYWNDNKVNGSNHNIYRMTISFLFLLGLIAQTRTIDARSKYNRYPSIIEIKI